jgi:acyl carrier protein
MTEATIMAFMKEQGKADGLTPDTDLFRGGYVNSLFAVEMVLYLEQTFKIRLADRDITPANFRTVASIAKLVDRTRGVQA